MGYFTQISTHCTLLNEIGQKYLDTLPFISNEEVIQLIWTKAYDIFESMGRWECEDLPDWVADTIDSGVPYSEIPRNGSLHYSLGFATTAQDACLRAYLEWVEGRDTELKSFQTLADLPDA